MLASRLHQQGQVVGGGVGSVYVCFPPDDQLVSLAPWLLRLLPDRPGGSVRRGVVMSVCNGPRTLAAAVVDRAWAGSPP